MRQEAGIRLCTVGNVVHDPHGNGLEDLRTYRSLSTHIDRVYLVAMSTDRSPRVIRRRRVVVVTLGQRAGGLFGRIAFLYGSVHVGRRLCRHAGVNIYAASDPLFGGLAGLILGRVSRKPLLVHLQGQLLNLPPGGTSGARRWAMSRLARFVCRRADMVRCVSRDLLYSAAAIGIPDRRLAYLPSRVDTERFSPEHREILRRSTRKELNAEVSKVLLFIGTFSKHKGVEHLLEALPGVLRMHAGAMLVLVGSGSLESLLRETGDRLGVKDSVIFAGRISHEEIPANLAAADVLILPSLNEGLPRVILEAMASGLPVVATDVGGIPELVEDGVTGLLVPPGDPNALATAICRLLDDPATAEAFGRAGRRVVEGEYERETNIRRYAELVESVARSGRRRS